VTTAKAQPETASALGRAALWYALHLGWRVFPLHSVDAAGCSCGSTDCAAGKHPRSHRGCLDATTDGDTSDTDDAFGSTDDGDNAPDDKPGDAPPPGETPAPKGGKGKGGKGTGGKGTKASKAKGKKK
jgi:hypothetical protein